MTGPGGGNNNTLGYYSIIYQSSLLFKWTRWTSLVFFAFQLSRRLHVVVKEICFRLFALLIRLNLLLAALLGASESKQKAEHERNFHQSSMLVKQASLNSNHDFIILDVYGGRWNICEKVFFSAHVINVANFCLHSPTPLVNRTECFPVFERKMGRRAQRSFTFRYGR